MGKTLRTAQPIYLDADKAKLLNELSLERQIPKAVLLREAVNDYLVKHRKLTPAAVNLRAEQKLDSGMDHLAGMMGFESAGKMLEIHQAEQAFKKAKRARLKAKAKKK